MPLAFSKPLRLLGVVDPCYTPLIPRLKRYYLNEYYTHLIYYSTLFYRIAILNSMIYF